MLGLEFDYNHSCELVEALALAFKLDLEFVMTSAEWWW